MNFSANNSRMTEKEGVYRMPDNNRFDYNDLMEGIIGRLKRNL